MKRLATALGATILLFGVGELPTSTTPMVWLNTGTVGVYDTPSGSLEPGYYIQDPKGGVLVATYFPDAAYPLKLEHFDVPPISTKEAHQIDTLYVDKFADSTGAYQYATSTKAQGDARPKDYQPTKTETITVFGAIFAPKAHAAIAFDQVTSTTSCVCNLTCTYSVTLASGLSNPLLLVGILDQSSDALDRISGVTYNAIAMTRLAAEVTGGGTHTPPVFIYGSTGVDTSAAHNVVVTCSINITVVNESTSYSGVSQSGLPDAANTGYSNNAASPLTVGLTIVAANSWEFSCESGWNQLATAGTGVTARGTAARQCGDSNAALPAGNNNMTYTWITTTDWQSRAEASFAPVAAATATFVPWQTQEF